MAFRLPRLPDDIEIIEPSRRATFKFQRWWQSVVSKIETQEGTQDELLAAVIAAQAAADAANAAAAAAQTAADEAQAAADAAQGAVDDASAAQNLLASGTSGCTITASDAGSNATITISAHDRIYGDGSSVGVLGGSVAGLSYTMGYYIYYSDPSRTGGAVAYGASTDPNAAVQAGAIHSVGAVATPASLGSPTFGSPTLPSGVVNP